MKNYVNQSLTSSPLMYDPIYRNLAEEAPLPSDPRKGPVFVNEFTAAPPIDWKGQSCAEILYYAPEASRVTMKTQLHEKILKKGADGYWHTDISDMSPGFHYVHFTANGVPVIHPQLPVGFGFSQAVNYIDIPGGDDFYFLNEKTPHGSLTMSTYYSEITRRERNCWVYTPPSYNSDTSLRYPVLYIQHGGGENETSWFWQGKLNHILDNLIAADMCSEMIAVTNAGYAYCETESNRFSAASFSDVMTKECVPFIDSTYRTLSDRNNRAIAGLSMGGGQSRLIAHNNTDIFSVLGVFSSGAGFLVKGEVIGEAFDFSALFSTPEHYNKTMQTTFIACGLDDMRHEYTSAQVDELIKMGYNITYNPYPGGHDWNVWRLCARDFLQQIFR